MTELSAPIHNDFLTELERYSVPLAICINGCMRQVPPEAWGRVFNGPHDERGRPVRTGGLTAETLSRMKNSCIKNQPHDALRRTADASAARERRMTFHSQPAVGFPESTTLYDSAPLTMTTTKGDAAC